MSVQVYIDGVEVTDCVQSGSLKRRLNRPWEASFTMFSDCAPGDACSRAKIMIDGSLAQGIHGFITQISTEAAEDGNLMSQYTVMDPMWLWQFRPARSGPDSSDPGDFSNPMLFADPSVFGPEILRQVLLQSIDDSNPADGEGTLFIDVATGTFIAGVVDLSGAPVDYPMSIAEVFELLASTGVVDCVLTPRDSGGFMADIDVFNGDYGNDLTATVAFEYATGDHNVRALRMTEDSTNICNKLWYYLGPRVRTPTDPAGDQHWRANVQGRDTGLAYPPGGKSFDETNTPFGPPWTDNQIGERIHDSRVDCGVRMEVRIFDAQGDENPAAFRELFRRMWQMESWIRAVPRTLVHVTPVRTSDFDLLPPGVVPVQVGDFDIGDLVTVTAGAIVRGGFTGAQRIYEYTITWDENGTIELGELLTSADQEGIV